MRELRISAEELVSRAESMRAGLSQPGESLALLAHNGVTALAGRTLANRLAVPLVPINPLLTASEIAHILADSETTALVVEAGLELQAEKALKLLGAKSPQLLTSDAPLLGEDESLLFPGSSKREFDASEIGATLIYTSGTTGTPKGCVRRAGEEYARARELIESYSIGAEDTQLIACPLAHSAPGIFLRAAHAAGADSLLLRRFRAPSFWQSCLSQKCTFFFLVPTQYRRLLEFVEDETIPETLRSCIVAGAPLTRSLHLRLLAWLGPDRLWQFYGSSETGTISISPPSPEVDASVGFLAPHVDVEIRNDEGKARAQGEIGEIFVRSPTLMSGYRSGHASHDANGFVSVGDLGYQDARARLFLVDRKDDTIITGGVNVYPAEVEAALLAHEQVRAAVVVGLDDEDWGQRVVAIVACDDSITASALRLHCEQRLARYKIPKDIHFYALEDMPLGSSGKPLRRAARALLI